MCINLICSCGAGFSMEIDDEENMTGAWMLIHRFANAHNKCGFMTMPVEEPLSKTKNIDR